VFSDIGLIFYHEKHIKEGAGNMKVIKRNGELEDFNKEKIYNAIEKAFIEVHGGFFEDDYHNMKEICDEVEESIEIDTNIEYIQDAVEESLMSIYPKVAKAYILYRDKRNSRRDSIKQVYYVSEFLSEEFLSQYSDYPDHMSPVSQFTFLRTYSRDIPELLRRETWKEACIRSIHHNINMDNRDRTPEVMEFLKREAEQMFDIQFNLRGFLSGRALFTGGSKAAEKYPLSLFNCSFIEPTKLEDFGDMLYLLSVGAGVGYRITWDVVDKLPLFKSKAKLIAMDYLQIPKNMRKEETKVHSYGTSKTIVVGDSKEGWQQSVVEFLGLMMDESIEEIKINYSNIRPEGEALKTFGGYASGHLPLQKMFEGIHEVLTGDYKDSHGNILTSKMVNGKLRPIHVMHISNMIAGAIVVGGVRRSAMISLFSRDDEEMKNAKRNFVDYSDPKISHYWLSNNTMIFEEGYVPKKEEIKDAVEILKTYGEPAFMNESELKRRHPEARGANPCF
jgi:ribonucleoside-diphosphate reductase alpha chain/ribonucleoside-triphosphate reductase